MHRTLSGIVVAFALATATTTAMATEPTLIEPNVLIADQALTTAQVNERILPARRYATFWSSGDEALATDALSPDFVDRTLPSGRLPGVAGALAASRSFRAAVPDLKCEVQQMILSGDRVISHLRFTGHFTGTFNGVHGKGQAVNFIATDIYRIEKGRIAENWHLEDNLTFMQQIGMVSPST